MNQGIRLGLLGVVAFCAVPAAHAEVFKCVDGAGKITYSEKEEPHSKCSPATGKINVVPATRAVAPSQKTGESNEGSGRSDLQRGQLAEIGRAHV